MVKTLLKKALPFLLVLLALSGCATTSTTPDTPTITAGKSLLATQQIIISVRDAIGAPCQQGVLKPDVCQAIDKGYRDSMPMYDAAADSELIAIQYAKQLAALQNAPVDPGDPNAADYQAKLTAAQAAAINAENIAKAKATAFQSLAADLATLAAKYGVQGGAK